MYNCSLYGSQWCIELIRKAPCSFLISFLLILCLLKKPSRSGSYLLVWLLHAGGHRVCLPQGGERPRPDVCDRCRDCGDDGLFGQRPVPIAVGAEEAEGVGRRCRRGRALLAKGLLRNTEEVHGEEDAPGQC